MLPFAERWEDMKWDEYILTLTYFNWRNEKGMSDREREQIKQIKLRNYLQPGDRKGFYLQTMSEIG